MDRRDITSKHQLIPSIQAGIFLIKLLETRINPIYHFPTVADPLLLQEFKKGFLLLLSECLYKKQFKSVQDKNQTKDQTQEAELQTDRLAKVILQ